MIKCLFAITSFQRSEPLITTVLRLRMFRIFRIAGAKVRKMRETTKKRAVFLMLYYLRGVFYSLLKGFLLLVGLLTLVVVEDNLAHPH